MGNASDVLIKGSGCFLVHRYVLTVTVCMRFMFCLMCANMTLFSVCCVLCKRVEWVGGML